MTVIYEDENIAVLYKPTHLLCHSDRTGDANLVDAFTQYLAQRASTMRAVRTASNLASATGWTVAPRGLVIAAKSYAALRDMNEIIRTDLLKRNTTPSPWASPERAVHSLVGARRKEQQGQHPCPPISG